MTDLPSNDTLKILLSQQNTKAQNKVAIDKSQIERIPETTARNIRKRTSTSEDKNIRTEGRVTKHDKSDTTKYQVKTNDGNIELRAQSTKQRPAIDQEITLTIPKEYVASQERPDATNTQISTSNPPQQTYPKETQNNPTNSNITVHLSPALTTPPLTQIIEQTVQLPLPSPQTPLITAITPATQHLDSVTIIANMTDAAITSKHNNLVQTLIINPLYASTLASDKSTTNATITNSIANSIANSITTTQPNITIKQNDNGSIQTLQNSPIKQPIIKSAFFDIEKSQSNNNFLGAKISNEATATLLTDAKAGQISAIITDHNDKNSNVNKRHIKTLPFNPPAQYTSAYSTAHTNTAEQIFTLQTNQQIQISIGSTISLSPHSPKQSTTSSQTTNLPHVAETTPALRTWGPLILTPQPWPLLTELQQTLLQIAPQQATALNALTPSTQNPAQMIPAALFFLTAIKSGDIQSWLGDKTIDVLNKNGKGKLLSRIGNELESHTRLAKEPSGEWRTHALPVQHNGEFHKIALHTKDSADESQDNKSNKKKNTRFIFDLDLDKIGPLQLDGFFHSNGQRLDIILRTQQFFSKTMQMHMKRIYAGALEQSQIYGDITFQNRPEQWVSVTPSAQHQTTKNV